MRSVAGRAVLRRSGVLAAALMVGLVPGPLVAQNGPDPTPSPGAVRDGLPLEPTRTLRFPATEGSWISVDVSPDGRTIVFDLLGDLYTMPITGGRATPLTRGMAYDAQPRFSPDGTRVVFISDRNGGPGVWTLSLDLTDTTQVTQGRSEQYTSPAWSPDGKYIVVTRRHELMVYHVDGGTGLPLMRAAADTRATLRYLGAAFSPDGRFLWASRFSLGFLPTHVVVKHDRESGETTEVASRTRGAFRPTLSPDGQWLVYGSRHRARTGLRIRDLRTGEERWLAYPVQRDDMESAWATLDAYPGMAFTPDSENLIAFYGGKLWSIPVDGSPPRNIPFEAPVELHLGPRVGFTYAIDDAPTFAARQIRQAVPSPDGGRLAFIALDRLYVMDWPAGTPRRVTSDDVVEHAPAWSPDGRWLTYATWADRPLGGHVMRVRAMPGSTPRRVSDAPALYQNPVFSPDGARIVVARSHALDRAYDGSRGPSEFVWFRAEGASTPTVIAPTDGLTRPHFRRDVPDRIFAFDANGRDRIVSMGWDGAQARDELRISGRATVMLMAPVGAQALVQVQNEIHVVTVPPPGGEPPALTLGPGAQLPSRILTGTIGGEFPAWDWNGDRVHWSIGDAHAAYDLARAAAVDEYEPAEHRIAVVVDRDTPQGAAALTGARIITMRGDEVIEDGVVVIRNHRIAAVGPRGQVDVPADARVIDVSGATIVPGFIDTHPHLWEERMDHVHREQSAAFSANLAYGVTTLREPASGTSVLTYADRVTHGDLVGPRVYTTGPAITSSRTMVSPTGTSGGLGSLDDARAFLRRYSEYYRTQYVKQYGAGNREQRQWLIQAAREQGLMPTTEGGGDIVRSITEAIDGYSGHEHTWTGYPHYSDRIRLFAASGVLYTPTILVAYGGPQAENFFFVTEDLVNDEKLARFTHPSTIARSTRRLNENIAVGWFHEEEHVFRDVAKTVADLVAAGGKAAVGSHGQLQGLGYHWELWAMQSGGLAEHDALRTATIFGAQGLGLDRDLGSIEPGKLADLVVLEANPLDDIRNSNTIRMVMKNGRLYDGDTLAELYPRQSPAPRFYWQIDEPDPAAGERR